MPCTEARILIADDEPSIRTSMSHALTEIGYSVRSADDGLTALLEINQEIPSILLSDLNMPGISGFELLSAVRRSFPSIKTIAMSGSFSGNEAPSGVVADAFYQKGSSMGALLRIIEALPSMAQRDPPSARIAAPLQIHRDRRDASRDASDELACPECLRTFPEPVDGSSSRERKAKCIYCGSAIQYSTAEPFNRMAQRASRQRAGTAISDEGQAAVGD
jgi:DNA-binding response OmpR family regulator